MEDTEKKKDDTKLSNGGFRYISPTTDFGFKKLFGDPRIMKGFLNALFSSKNLNLSRNCWTNVETHEISSDRQEYWKVQLPYFRKHNLKMEDCTTKSDYWLYNIANMDTMEELAFKEKDSDFVYLSELAEFRAMSIPEQDRYIRQIDREVVWKNVMDRKYRFGFSDGKEEGRAEGMAEGRAEGMAAGERAKAIETARKMKLRGYSVDVIADITNLTPDEIAKI